MVSLHPQTLITKSWKPPLHTRNLCMVQLTCVHALIEESITSWRLPLRPSMLLTSFQGCVYCIIAACIIPRKLTINYFSPSFHSYFHGRSWSLFPWSVPFTSVDVLSSKEAHGSFNGSHGIAYRGVFLRNSGNLHYLLMYCLPLGRGNLLEATTSLWAMCLTAFLVSALIGKR